MIIKSWVRYYAADTTGGISTTPDVDTQVDLVTCNITRGRDNKNNVAELTFNNPIESFFSDNTPKRKFVDGSGNLTFRAARKSGGWTRFEERFEIYMKWVDDATEDIVDDNNLVFNGQIKEASLEHSRDKCSVKLSCSDRTFNILNKIHGESFEAQTSPEIIKEIIRRKTEVTDTTSEGYDTTGSLVTSGLRYYVDVRTFTEGTKGSTTVTTASGKNLTLAGTITGLAAGDLLKNDATYKTAIVKSVSGTSVTVSKNIFTDGVAVTGSDGFLIDFRPDDSVFPDISFGMKNKPLNEWISNLLEMGYTNSPTEFDLNNNPSVVKRPYIFYVDGKNRFHTFYPDNEPSAEAQSGLQGTVGDDLNEYTVYKVSVKQGVFDIINYIIFKCGEDMEGAQVSWYAQDPTSGGPITRESYRPFIKVAENMKIEDVVAGNTVYQGSGQFDYPSSYPMTPAWDREAQSVANDTEYNANFIEEARRRGHDAAMAIINQTANPRFQGNTEFAFFNFNPTDLIRFTDKEIGVNRVLFRIEKVQHNLSKNGMFTTLNLKEDIPEAGT